MWATLALVLVGILAVGSLAFAFRRRRGDRHLGSAETTAAPLAPTVIAPDPPAQAPRLAQLSAGDITNSQIFNVAGDYHADDAAIDLVDYATVRERMSAVLNSAFTDPVRTSLDRRPIPRPEADRRLQDVLARRLPFALVTAPAGTGKTAWSARHALAVARTSPTLWTPANALPLNAHDPLSLKIVQAALGASDAALVRRLAAVLRRENAPLTVFLDGVDEVHDAERLIHALREFRSSALSVGSRIVLMCREEALVAFHPHIQSLDSHLLDPRQGRLIRLEPLRDSEATTFLLGEGAREDEARAAQTLLPTELAGIPLFLKHALNFTRSGTTITVGRHPLRSIAGHAVDEVHRRLRQGGIGPTRPRIERFLRDFARAAVLSPTETVSTTRVSELLGPDFEYDGENSLLGRCTHAGLLEVRTEEQFAFAHALFLENFAAQVIESAAPMPWPPEFPALTSFQGQLLAKRTIAFVEDPTPLLRHLLSIDPLAACECAARLRRPTPTALSNDLARAARDLLDSRFASDRLDALRVLGALATPSARDVAVDWWNGASSDERTRFLWQAADVFLTLEVSSAMHIIACHRMFLAEMPWYEPREVAELSRRSPGFRTAMANWAKEQLRTPTNSDRVRLAAVAMLALLGDSSLVGHLRERVRCHGTLCDAEHRALIHLNSEESILVYAESAESRIGIPLSEYQGETDEERNNARAQYLDGLRLLTTDVRMYPHDALKDLVVAALSSRRSEHVWLGLSWAEFLQDPELIAPYVAAKRTRRGYLDAGPRLIDNVAKTLPFARIRELYDSTSDADLQSGVVSALCDVPGPETESFLLHRLARSEHTFYAVQSLGSIRATGASHAILQLYRATTNRNIRWVAVRALGRLRAADAVTDLIDNFRRVVRHRGEDAYETSEEEYCLISALGQIGTREALQALVDEYSKSQYPEMILSALLHDSNPEWVARASALVLAHRAPWSTVVRGLGSHRVDDGWSPWVYPIPTLTDRPLLEVVLAGLADPPGHRDPLARHWKIQALARFDLPEAEAALRSIAESNGEQAWEANEILASRGNLDAQRRFVEWRLSQILIPDHPVSQRHADELCRWSPGVLREALLRRLVKNESVGVCLLLLQWCATDAEVSLFESYENDANEAVADIAHQFLRKGVNQRSRGSRRR
ncbi:hypothetical protein [Sorangium sp. So ce1099]|uniref:hypothetical protein n=1 Tax=Sorangium sp. So ce1099 TaxID=3133331 RepID=UPI003F601617